MPQVTFRALAEPQVWGAASYSPLARLGSNHYPPTLFLLIHSYPHSWSHSPTHFMFPIFICFMFPVPDPCSVPLRIAFLLLYFCFHYCFRPYAHFPWPCYVPFDTYTLITSCMFSQSEINIDCPLWTPVCLIWTFWTLWNPHPSKLRTRERQEVKHQSLSHVLVKC